jgi:hypothetical protein
MPDSPREELARRLADYPKEASAFFNNGFIAAGKLSDETRALVLKEMTASFRRGMRRFDGSTLRPITNFQAANRNTWRLHIPLLSDF